MVALIFVGIIIVIVLAIYIYTKWESKHATNYHNWKNEDN